MNQQLAALAALLTQAQQIVNALITANPASGVLTLQSVTWTPSPWGNIPPVLLVFTDASGNQLGLKVSSYPQGMVVNGKYNVNYTQGTPVDTINSWSPAQ